MGKQEFTVTTWENRYGRMHADVLIPNAACLGRQVQRAARRALVAALEKRESERAARKGCEPREIANVGLRFIEIKSHEGKAWARYEEQELNKR